VSDLAKIKERASEAFAKSKFSKAAELYEEYCKSSPKDLQTRLRMGDAFARAGNKVKAIGAYQFAAEGFAKDGFLPRAIAASKLILELDPAHQGVQHMLADLYARRGIGDGKAPVKKPAVTVSPPAPVSAPAPVAAPPSAPEPVFVKPTIVPPPPPAPEPVVAKPAPAPAKTPEPVFELPPPEPTKPTVQPIEIELDSGTGGEEISLEPDAPEDEFSQAFGAELKGGRSAEELVAELAKTTEAPPQVHVLEPKRAPKVEAIELPEEEIDLEAAAKETEAELAQPAPAKPAAPELSLELEIDLDAAAKEAEAQIARPVEPPKPVEVAKPAEPPKPAPAPAPKPVEAPKPRAAPSSASIELSLEDAGTAELLEQEKPNATPPPAPPMPTRVAPGNAVAPPGLRRKPPEAPPAAPPPKTAATARRGSELQASLAAFSKFDELDLGEGPLLPEPRPAPVAPPPPAPAPAAPVAKAAPAPAPVATMSVSSFTELELGGDSLLHAVEQAAQRNAEAPGADEESLGSEPAREEARDDRNLPEIPLFSDLPPDAFIALFERCPLKRLVEGEKVIQQGTVGDAFYVICEGKVRVVREEAGVERELATLEHGAFFGEMALLSGAPRTASVVSASEDTQLLEISAPVLADLSTLYPQIAQALKKFCRQRMLNNVMESSPLFRPFNKHDRRSLIEKFKAREVKPRDVVIHQGQRSDGLYVVLSGEMEVRLSQENKLLARLKEGDLFGEMSMLQKSPASASVIASKRSSLLRLPKDDFDALILSHPQILVLVSELTDDRRRQNEALLAKSPPATPEGDEPLVMV
jgi:CRP-like cAMP-binding protein